MTLELEPAEAQNLLVALSVHKATMDFLEQFGVVVPPGLRIANLQLTAKVQAAMQPPPEPAKEG